MRTDTSDGSSLSITGSDAPASLVVMHIIAGLGKGGAEGVLARLATGERTFRHVVVSLTDLGVHGAHLLDRGIDVYPLGMKRGTFSLNAIVKLVRLIRKVRPDVVQTWMYHSDLIGGVTARLLNIRAVLWGVRNTDIASRHVPIKTKCVALFCALLSRIIPVRIVSCAKAAVATHQRIGYDVQRMTVIPNGFDTELLWRDLAARDRLRQEWAISPSTFVFGLIARWDPQKDHRNLIKAFALVHARDKQSCLVLAGPGITRDNVELCDLLEASGLGESVLLLGQRSDPSKVLSALDCFVLSSRDEGFPNVVAEAMACETPVVITDVGDAALIAGDVGLIVRPQDADALAAAMRAIRTESLDDDRSRIRVRRGRKRIVNEFSMHVMIERFRSSWMHAIRSTTGVRER